MNETIYIGAVKLKVLRKSIAIIIQNEPLENAGISQTSYSGGAFIGKTIITARLIKSLTAPVVFGAQINSGGSTAQVNSDWNATSGVAEILNKPTIPSDISQLTDNTGAIPSNTSDLTNDSNLWLMFYVHTDNNYSNTEKQKVADCEMMRDVMYDASKHYFYDNFLYVKKLPAVGQIGLSFYSLAHAARSLYCIETGYGKKEHLELNNYTNAADSMVNALISVIPSYGIMTLKHA